MRSVRLRQVGGWRRLANHSTKAESATAWPRGLKLGATKPTRSHREALPWLTARQRRDTSSAARLS